MTSDSSCTSATRRSGIVLANSCGHLQPRLHRRGQRRTGSDRVDADVLRPEFGSPRLGEQLDRRPRRAVGSHAWLAVARDHRGDVDDRAAAAGGDLRGERGDEKERRLDVDLEQTVERRLVGVNRRSEGGKAGTVDQDIDLPCRVGDARTSDISEKSAAMNCASCPPARISSTVLAPRVSSRPVMITDAPFSAIDSATAIPIPEVPPVIRALLSCRSIVDIPSIVGTDNPLLLGDCSSNGSRNPI